MSELYDLFLKYPRISTDTRKIEPDSIFFALRGENVRWNSVGADDSVRPDDDNTIPVRADRVVGPYNHLPIELRRAA